MDDSIGNLGKKGDLHEHEMIIDNEHAITMNDFVVVKHWMKPYDDILCKVMDITCDGHFKARLNPMTELSMPFLQGTKVYKASPEMVMGALDINEKPDRINIGKLRGFGIPVWIDTNCFLRHVSVLGTTGSGKTYTTAVLLEELARLNITSIVVDKKGDFVNIPNVCDNVRVLKLVDRVPEYDEMYAGGKITIINASGVEEERLKVRVHLILNRIWSNKTLDKPLMVILDEAHLYAPQGKGKGEGVARKVNLFASEGRGHGLGLIVITQRPAKISKDVLAQCNFNICLGIRDNNDLTPVVTSTPGLSNKDKDMLQHLGVGQAVIYGGNIKVPLIININPRKSIEEAPVKLIDIKRQDTMDIELEGVTIEDDEPLVLKPYNYVTTTNIREIESDDMMRR